MRHVRRSSVRLRHGATALAFSGALVLSAMGCGSDDDDDNGGGSAARGASAGKGGDGASGKSSAGRGGGGTDGAGKNGNGGEAGDTGATSSGGTAGQSGGNGGGEAGAAGGASGPLPLTVRDEVKKKISAEDGGTLTLGRFSLEIPPDALEKDTEITIKSFEESETLFVLEPDGLTFETPVQAYFTLPALEADEEGPVVVLAETASIGELSELVDNVSVERVDDEYRATLDLEHFSWVRWLQPDSASLDAKTLFVTDDLTAKSLGDVPVGVELGIVHAYSTRSSPNFEFTFFERNNDNYATELSGRMNAITLTETIANSRPPLQVRPDGWLAVDGSPELGKEPVTVTRFAHCEATGKTSVSVEPRVQINADMTWTRVHIEYDLSVGYRYFRPITKTVTPNVTFYPELSLDENHAVNCVEGPSVIGAFANAAIAAALRARFKAAWQDLCYFLSDASSCQSPDLDLALVNVLDPVLEVGPNAAARIEAAFPCGAGPVGTTVCGTPGEFAEGEYVFLLATLGADIATDDPVGMYQHAFVFDADGDTSNNYVPSSQYPKDFFQGTDKWYQLFYTPADGFDLRVVDARISTSNPVTSGARMIVAGRELAAFIPRNELDGTEPGFRVTTFRHEGDYGLDGGPWSASYHPPLGEPLMPAAAGDTIVLPED